MPTKCQRYCSIQQVKIASHLHGHEPNILLTGNPQLILHHNVRPPQPFKTLKRSAIRISNPSIPKPNHGPCAPIASSHPATHLHLSSVIHRGSFPLLFPFAHSAVEMGPACVHKRTQAYIGRKQDVDSDGIGELGDGAKLYTAVLSWSADGRDKDSEGGRKKEGGRKEGRRFCFFERLAAGVMSLSLSVNLCWALLPLA